MKTDLYDRVTGQIVASLEAGVRPWVRPWSAGPVMARPMRPLRGNGVPYRGINVLMLWGAAMDRGFDSPTWLTFRHAKELGAFVRKGETGSLVVYADRITRSETDEVTGEESERAIPFLKGYTVFNVAQIDGLPDRFHVPPVVPPAGIARIERAERFVATTGATVRHGGDRACYSPATDSVRMPPLQAFRDAESYYATLAHELTHWTGHPSRLARSFGKRFGDRAYALEELIAELGAAFLCADLALTPEPRVDHADYLGHWLGILKADRRAIFTAASQAQRAADLLTAAAEPDRQAA